MVDPSLRPLLDRFHAAVLADPTVLGVLYTGSLGRGTTDRFSDLDLEVWLTDDGLADRPAKTRELLSAMGSIEWMAVREPGFIQAHIEQHWHRVDLYLHASDDLEPRPAFADAQVIKDIAGTLSRLVADSRPDDVFPTWEEARETIQNAIDQQIYIADNNARGAIWEAMCFHCEQWKIYELLARQRGHRTFGHRLVESLLSPAELDLLQATWPTAPTQTDVRRAAADFWVWTRYVWDMTERTLGRSLGIELDEAGLLAAIDARYAPSE